MGCPMGFGELNIPSSRAFFDDCDEDEFPKESVEKLQLKYEQGVSIQSAARLLVIEGPNVADFAEHSLLMDCTKLAEIPSKRSSLHYLQKSNMLIAIIEEDLTTSGEICELLLEAAKPKEVIALTIKPKVDFKSENIALVREEITFIRSIDGKVECIEALESPNFIAGVAAGVCSWCHSMGLDAQSYVAYTDNVALDAKAAQPIIQLLRDLNINCRDSYRPKKQDDSHLYL